MSLDLQKMPNSAKILANTTMMKSISSGPIPCINYFAQCTFALTEFPRFSELPFELRKLIWEAAKGDFIYTLADHHKNLQIYPNNGLPGMLLACRESFLIAKQRYQIPRPRTPTVSGQPIVPRCFNLKSDILLMADVLFQNVEYVTSSTLNTTRDQCLVFPRNKHAWDKYSRALCQARRVAVSINTIMSPNFQFRTRSYCPLTIEAFWIWHSEKYFRKLTEFIIYLDDPIAILPVGLTNPPSPTQQVERIKLVVTHMIFTISQKQLQHIKLTIAVSRRDESKGDVLGELVKLFKKDATLSAYFGLE